MGGEDSGIKRVGAARFDSFDVLETSQLEVKPPRKYAAGGDGGLWGRWGIAAVHD